MLPPISGSRRARWAGGDASELAIDIANAVWAQQGMSLETPFVDTLGLNYGAGVALCDFRAAPELCKAVINAWVLEKTKGLIKDLLSNLDSTTRLVLVNAIHFLGKWQLPFSEQNTKPDVFHGPGGDIYTDFMEQKATFSYCEGLDFQAVELKYVDANLSMLFVLPDATAFATWEATMDATRLNEVIDALTPAEVVVKIPLFEFESSLPLTTLLPRMGMDIPFINGVADFSGMTLDEPLHIKQVVHKAFIAIDEKKTEAAAATAVVNVNDTGGMNLQGSEFIADHPFLYFIRDRTTGALLFMGRVTTPVLP